jgi:hypothetical protein
MASFTMQVPETRRMSAGIVVSTCWRTGRWLGVSLGVKECGGGGATNRRRLCPLGIVGLFVNGPPFTIAQALNW